MGCKKGLELEQRTKGEHTGFDGGFHEDTDLLSQSGRLRVTAGWFQFHGKWNSVLQEKSAEVCSLQVDGWRASTDEVLWLLCRDDQGGEEEEKFEQGA